MQEYGAEPLVGSIVDGRYEVLGKVARGGMATVYRATDLRLERDVALKVLHPHLSMDASFLHRLGSEAKAAARLSHPHVVGVLDQGEEMREGHRVAYLVMEFLPGHTLRDVLHQKHRLSPREALDLLDPIVEGLSAAHRGHLVHRDIKPENVLIADDGRIKVADFGLARAVTTTTSTGTLIGTVAYLSPELVLGRTADTRSDIYAVGIMLYEMLVGVAPFVGEVPIQVAYQHVNSVVPAPSLALPGLAPDLDELVRWCTDPDPENRPADGGALLGELRHIRSTLSDAELDFRAGQPSTTEFLPSATEAIGPPEAIWPAATQLIQRAPQAPLTAPTTAMPSRARLTVDTDESPRVKAPSARALQATARREERQEAKTAARLAARAAATPTATLHRGNTRRRGWIWLILVLILALLGATAGWYFGAGPGALATVPDLRDKTVAEANAQLTQLGFTATIRQVNDEIIGQGHVVTSEPVAHTEQRKFQGVVLLVSSGPVLYAVPPLVGSALADARNSLTATHLVAGKVTERYDDTAPAGQVLEQAVAPGTMVRTDTAVDLVVSKGPTPIPVPSVVGKTQAEATKALQALSLVAAIDPQQVFSSSVPSGSVVSQTPVDGTLTKGSSVTLVLSKGPEMVTAPNTFGKDEADAVATLKGLGFDVKVSYTYGTPLLGKVVGQDKTGLQPKGSVIR
ncbi:Stk1 family PASTA domain-containing Ser/Thr kinase, partial [Psychromicrobium xiongbiense]|uniref:Stk1 family PASTA domain-containing Ser/Thr kinase n=1 Tax=Psychromicrobium xiongbiense TaxID=3051184 RepID=UPI002554AD7F